MLVGMMPACPGLVRPHTVGVQSGREYLEYWKALHYSKNPLLQLSSFKSEAQLLDL